ncbi:TIGR02270 family protein [Myxococcus sp. Y35]|uniref:TIGR02270 family protein n=1 Tax=Pseudomyxococcus flavus TaxID=3115648 RepID=UPI003CE9A617
MSSIRQGGLHPEGSSVPPRRWSGFAPREISALCNEEMVALHAGEAAFLWTQRAHAVGAPHYRLKDLIRLDGRLEAHLDGLRTAGEKGWEKCMAAMDVPGPGEVFAAGVLACESRDGRRIGTVVKLALEAPEWQRACVSALGWLSFADAVPTLEALLEEQAPEVRRLGVAGAAAQRWDLGPHLGAALGDEDASLRACALETVGLLARADLLPKVQRALTDDEDEACRFAAAWTLVRLGQRTGPAFSLLQALGDSAGPFARRALSVAMPCMPQAQAKAWYSRLREAPQTRRLAAIAAGVLGDAEHVKDLLAWMAEPAVAREAGEAFALLTGIDLAWEGLDAEPPQDEVAVEDETAAKESENLPWPATEKVAAWWHQHQGDFQKGTRYLVGKPISDMHLREVLRQGTQRQRAAAALEWGLRKPQAPLFEVRAPGPLQARRLAAWTS